MLGKSVIGQPLKITCGRHKSVVPLVLALNLGQNRGREGVLFGVRELGDRAQCLLKQLGHTWSIALGRFFGHRGVLAGALRRKT